MEHQGEHGPAQEVPGGGEVGDGGIVWVSGPGPHGGHQDRGQVQEESNLRQGQGRELETGGQWIPAPVRREDRGGETRLT